MLAQPALADILNYGRLVSRARCVRLFGRRHTEYIGPIYAWAACYWIVYGNEPVRVYPPSDLTRIWSETPF